MADKSFAENPWSADFWNLTKQGMYLKKYGPEVAKTKAKQAGTSVTGPRPVSAGAVIHHTTVLVQRRNITTNNGGGDTDRYLPTSLATDPK